MVEIYDSSFLFGKSRNQPLRVLLLALDPSSSKLLCLPSLLGAGLTGPGISNVVDFVPVEEVPYHMNVDMSNCESLLAACEDLYSARTVHGSLRWSSLDRPSAFSVGWPVYFRITVKSITVLQVFRKGNFLGFWNAGMLECWNA